MDKTPLRYNISSWDQLVECMSNYSSSLHLEVKHILQDSRVTGTVIEVIHEELGVLFGYLVNGTGPLLASDDPLEYELSCADVLKQLERFGYLITFDCQKNISSNQVEFLRTLDGLGFDKIRLMDVYTYSNTGVKVYTPHVVVFNIRNNPGWLDNTYSASNEEFLDSLSKGYAVDVSGISQSSKYHWDWLDFVGSIKDILKEYDDLSEDGGEIGE